MRPTSLFLFVLLRYPLTEDTKKLVEILTER